MRVTTTDPLGLVVFGRSSWTSKKVVKIISVLPVRCIDEMIGPQNTSHRARILIVEDESQIRELLFDVLRNDFDCSVAATADETLETVKDSSFDVVISDIDLGIGQTGTELVREILRISPFDYIKKPFDLDYLEIVVQRAYAHRLLLVEKRRHEKDLEHLVRQSTEQLNYLSFYDPLTNLPNRALFEDRVTQAFIAAGSSNKIALILLTIDGFRNVQQTLGHANSDQMLTETGRRLQHGVGQSCTVSRYERDEFAVLMTTFETEEILRTRPGRSPNR